MKRGAMPSLVIKANKVAPVSTPSPLTAQTYSTPNFSQQHRASAPPTLSTATVERARNVPVEVQIAHDVRTLSSTDTEKKTTWLFLRRHSRAELCRAFYIPFLTSSHPPPVSTDPAWTRAIYSCTCPPHGLAAKFMTRLLVAVFTWCLLFGIVKDDALPQNGKFFALWLIVFGGLAAGWLVQQIHLPALFGMLLWGFALRNVPWRVDVATNIYASADGRAWAAQLRNIALAVILLRAGLGLDVRALKRLKWVVLSLSLIPSSAVVVTMLLLGHFLLALPYEWSLLLGLVSCAVSPAVIVPLMLTLQDERYGTQKGIPSAVIAAATLGGVLAVCGFGLVLGLIFSTGSLTVNILRAPVEIAIGVSYGIVAGVILWYIPARSASTKALSVVTCRTILLVCAGVAAVCCAKVLSITGAGILGCLLAALVSAHGWAKQRDESASESLSNNTENVDLISPVAIALKFVWLYVFQPLLFGLIGAAVALQQLRLQTVLYALVVILIAHIAQFVVAFAVVSLRQFNFTLRERAFLALTALPKATIQAAIGSVALDTVRERYVSSKPDWNEKTVAELADYNRLEQYGQNILTVAVLCIILTAPLGALGIALGGRRLLEKEEDVKQSSSA